MFTAAELAAAAGTLSSDAQIMVTLYVRQASEYRLRPQRYQPLDDQITLAAATATLAKPINCILARLSALEDDDEKVVRLSGGDKGVLYNRDAERQIMQNYLLAVLFDAPLVVDAPVMGTLDKGPGEVCPEGGSFSDPLVL